MSILTWGLLQGWARDENSTRRTKDTSKKEKYVSETTPFVKEKVLFFTRPKLTGFISGFLAVGIQSMIRFLLRDC